MVVFVFIFKINDFIPFDLILFTRRLNVRPGTIAAPDTEHSLQRQRSVRSFCIYFYLVSGYCCISDDFVLIHR